MTDYVSTRWYRAPELLLGSEDYTMSVDMWAIGCIFAELLTRRPFLPGADSENQLKLIINMVGVPDKDTIKACGGHDVNLIGEVKMNEDGETRKFAKKFKDVDPAALKLLKKMLVFDPRKRISVADALKDEFFEDLH